jgi:hypothetical protein
MAISQQLQNQIEAVAEELLRDLYGPKGFPAWGTKFIEIEEQTAEVGDALACAMLSRGLRKQAEDAGHAAGKCSGCDEPIPLEEIAGRLLQAKRGEAVWQESYGRCKRCRKAFFPSVPSFGNCAG